MALHGLYCADVPLRNCSLTHCMCWRRSEWSTQSMVWPVT